MIQINLNSGNVNTTPLYQWDYGQLLHIYISEYQNTYATIQVHFTNKVNQRAIVRIATLDDDHYVVAVPDILLEQPYAIDAYVYIAGDDVATTTHHIVLPVEARKKPESFISKPDESANTLLENALNDINKAYAKGQSDIESAINEMETNYRSTDEYLTEKYEEANEALQAGIEEVNKYETIVPQHTTDIEVLMEKMNAIAEYAMVKQQVDVSGTTGTTATMGYYAATVTKTIPKNLEEDPTISEGTTGGIVNTISYNASTGVCTCTIYGTSASSIVSATITYKITAKEAWA